MSDIVLDVLDISNHQRGAKLGTLFEKSATLDAVICKTSGSTWFTDDTADPWIQWLRANNRPWGFYHFLGDGHYCPGGKREAQYFVQKTANYFGEGIPVADYEADVKDYYGTGYLYEFLTEVYRLTGIKPMVYVSCGVIPWQDFSKIAAEGYPLWIAQYANNQFTSWQTNPWQNGSVAPFDKFVMHQYTSHGRIPGWNGNLDMNRFYGSVDEWNALARGEAAPEPLKGADPVVIAAVLLNEYGIEPERSERLRAIGYDPHAAQKKINELYAVADKVRPLVASNMDYLNSIMKILRQ